MIITQIINIFTPQVDFLISGLLKVVAQHLDKGLCSCLQKSEEKLTKSQTIHNYVELHTGPEYSIFFKYSFILKMILFSTLYGCTMPIVFLINFVAFLNMYFTERLLLAWFYKKPPVIDGRVSLGAIKNLFPISSMGMLSAFWMLGEPCTLLGEVKPLENLRQKM